VHPEVIVVSSIPDRNTATFLSQVATSVLVVALMPAQSAAQAVTACMAMGVSPAVLADSLTTITCQRLVRRVCDICKEAAEPPAAQTLAAHGIDAETAASLSFSRGKGCPTCNRVGYRGRVAVFEVMPVSPDIRTGIRNGLGSDELNALAVGAEMRPMRDRCIQLIREGVTTFDEFVRLRL